MHGLIAYTGLEEAAPILIEGLRNHRDEGSGSAGIAVQNGRGVDVLCTDGRDDELSTAFERYPVRGRCGIGLARLATSRGNRGSQGRPGLDCTDRIAVVHDGLLENASALRALLTREGHTFRTGGDAEILAHLIERYWVPPLHLSVARALSVVEGTCALTVLCSDEPGRLVAARRGSPLIVGIGHQEVLVSSAVAPLIPHARRVMHLEDGEMAVADGSGVDVVSIEGLRRVERKGSKIDLTESESEDDAPSDIIARTIRGQPECIEATLAGRLPARGSHVVRLRGLDAIEAPLTHATRLTVVGSGSSWYAGIVGKYAIEEYAGVSVDVENAAEWRYREPVTDPRSVLIGLSQSGESPDTVAALRRGRELGMPTLAVMNGGGSTLARFSDAALYLHSGQDAGVPSSIKTFPSQVTAMTMLSLYLRGRRGLGGRPTRRLIEELRELPPRIRQVLETTSEQVQHLARVLVDVDRLLLLGCGYGYPAALEGTLQLKELARLHAEVVWAAETVDGPPTLVDEGTPVLAIAPRERAFDKVYPNLQAIRASGGRVIAVTSSTEDLSQVADECILIPETVDCLLPVLAAVPLQLLAHHIGILRGVDLAGPVVPEATSPEH